MGKRRAKGEGTIFKRKNGYWVAEYFDHTGKRRTLYAKTQQGAMLKLKNGIRESENAPRLSRQDITLGAWMKEWLEIYHKPTVRESTYSRAYDIVNSHIVPAFPDVLLKNLRGDMLQRFIAGKAANGRLDGKGGLCAQSLKKLKVYLSAALGQAVEDNLIPKNVAASVKLPRKKITEIKILAAEEQKILERGLLSSDNHLCFAIFLDLYTGLRFGELMGLKVSDIDFGKKQLSVKRTVQKVRDFDTMHFDKIIVCEPKTNAGRRTVPLPNFILPMLENYLADREVYIGAKKNIWGMHKRFDKKIKAYEDGYLFVTSHGTIPDITSMRGLLDKILCYAGIGHIKFHALRHTFATRCVEAGFDVKTLSAILGHTDVGLTLNLYTHALDAQKRFNMDKITMLSGS
jgi:integrase